MRIFPKSDFVEISSPSHSVFKFVENRFWKWINQGYGERKEMYFGDPEFGGGIYDKKGAIQQAIENALDEANETGSPVSLFHFDLEAAFE